MQDLKRDVEEVLINIRENYALPTPTSIEYLLVELQAREERLVSIIKRMIYEFDPDISRPGSPAKNTIMNDSSCYDTARIIIKMARAELKELEGDYV